MRKVLCIGFSVTEMDASYTTAAVLKIAERKIDIDLHKCGIGGIGVATLCHIIDEILDLHPLFDGIIFEIATGSGRVEFLEQRSGLSDTGLLRDVEYLVLAARRRGLPVGFLSFPRLDTDYAIDPLELAIFAVCSTYDVKVRSLTYRALIARLDLATMLPDNVHVTAEGANLYAEELLNLLDGVLHVPRSTSEAIEGAPYALAVSHLCDTFDGTFERHGYGCRYRMLPQGTDLAIKFDRKRHLVGMTFLCGPTSGAMRISGLDGEDVATFDMCDEYGYYTRFSSALFARRSLYGVRLECRPLQGCVELRKGMLAEGPRQASLCHLLFRD